MLVPLAILVLLTGGGLPVPVAPQSVAVLPEEPGVVVLPDASILQTVVADMDGDGDREILRLVRGPDDENLVEVWRRGATEWSLVGDPMQVVPPSRIDGRIDPVHLATPVRMVVRTIDGGDRVTVASQPHFEEIDVGPPCCLVLQDLLLGADGVTVRTVSEASDFSDAVLVIDFDGDGTDELLSTRSLPPLGDLQFPTEARVHRWDGDRFAPPTVTELPVGSGHAPMLLGDSDGLPGEEALIVSGDPGPRGIYRVRLAGSDALEVDAGGIPATAAVAAPSGEGRGVAVVGPTIGFAIAPWPAGAPIGAPTIELTITDGRIVGIATDAGPRVVVHEAWTESLRILGGTASGLSGITVTRSPAAARLADAPLTPFSGPIPGGGVDGEPAVIHQGRLIPSPFSSQFDGSSIISSLAGAEPVGFVGGGGFLALDHAPVGRQPSISPSGGPLVVPTIRISSWTSIAPLETVAEREQDDGLVDPPLSGARPVDERGTIEVGPAGFLAAISAPPGSRVFVVDGDPSVLPSPLIVGAAGRVDAPLPPPTVATANPRYRATVLVQTPAGRAYQAVWNVRVRNQPPDVAIDTSTPFGSSSVELTGRTAEGATVRVGGSAVLVEGGSFEARVAAPPWPTDVLVEVDDGLGNRTMRSVTVVGWFDYRGLPWVPISAGLIGAVALVLFLRVPRTAPLPRRPDDDAVYEEIEPD